MIRRTLVLLVLVLLQGCQERAAEPRQEAKSLDYYSQNAEIAKAVAEKCINFERQELSKLPGGEQRRWLDSSEGVGCQNAKTALSYQVIAERQRKLRESTAALRGK